MNLYDLTLDVENRITSALNAVDSGESECFDINCIQGELDEKRLRVAAYCKNLEADIKAIDDYRANMERRHIQASRRLEYLKESLLSSMLYTNAKKVESPELSVSIRESERCVVDDNLIPHEYMIEKRERFPDRNRIKELIKGGQEIPGASLKKTYHVNIK